MTAPATPSDPVAQNLRQFIAYLRPRLSMTESDAVRLDKLRRVADLRVREARVRHPKMSIALLNEVLSPDPAKPRFSSLAVSGGLLADDDVRAEHDHQSEVISIALVAILLHLVMPPGQFDGLMAAFSVEAKPAPAETPKQESHPTTVLPVVAADAQGSGGLPARIQKLLSQVDKLWSVPQVLQKVTTLLSDLECTVEAVASEMEQDPAMATLVLKTVNSAHYGVAKRIGSAYQAILMLGFRTVKMLVMRTSLVNQLNAQHGELEFDFPEFWGHCLQVAHTATILGREREPEMADDYFTAGLLHDIGKLVEYQYLRGLVKQVQTSVAAGSRYEDAERRLLETTHAEIGAHVCERWQFPEFVLKTIRGHLRPKECLVDEKIPFVSRLVIACCAADRRMSEADVGEYVYKLGIPPEQFRKARKEATQLALASVRDYVK